MGGGFGLKASPIRRTPSDTAPRIPPGCSGTCRSRGRRLRGCSARLQAVPRASASASRSRDEPLFSLEDVLRDQLARMPSKCARNRSPFCPACPQSVCCVISPRDRESSEPSCRRFPQGRTLLRVGAQTSEYRVPPGSWAPSDRWLGIARQPGSSTARAVRGESHHEVHRGALEGGHNGSGTESENRAVAVQNQSLCVSVRRPGRGHTRGDVSIGIEIGNLEAQGALRAKLVTCESGAGHQGVPGRSDAAARPTGVPTVIGGSEVDGPGTQ